MLSVCVNILFLGLFNAASGQTAGPILTNNILYQFFGRSTCPGPQSLQFFLEVRLYDGPFGKPQLPAKCEVAGFMEI